MRGCPPEAGGAEAEGIKIAQCQGGNRESGALGMRPVARLS